MFAAVGEMVSVRYCNSGYLRVSPAGVTNSQYSTVYGVAQWLENIVTKVSKTTLAFVKSVAVHSMKIFLVFNVIFE